MSVADDLSLVRIPLGLVFLLVAGQQPWALAISFVAATGNDRRARRLDRAAAWPAPPRGQPHRGDWLDPLCDKLFAAAVVAGLHLAPPARPGVLFLAREMLQVVAVTVMRMVPVLHPGSRDFDFRAHPVGKAATVAQFATAAALLLGHPSAWGSGHHLCAVLGVVSVTIYINRLRRTQAPGAAAASAAHHQETPAAHHHDQRRN